MSAAREKNEKNIHAGHRARLRKQFAEHGLEGFTDVQAIELLLSFAIPRQDTNPLAHRLLDRFRSFRGVLEADYADLQKVDGIGPESALLLRLVTELNVRYLRSRLSPGARLRTGDEICDYVRDLFRYHTVEEVYLLCLNPEGRVIDRLLLNAGSVTEVGLSMREIVQLALQNNAAAVVLTHNHLTELALPSRADIETTRRLYRALALIGVELLDHVIVAEDDCVSLRDSGWFKDF